MKTHIIENSNVKPSNPAKKESISIEQIQTLERSDFLRLQSILEHGDVFGFWATPKKWSPTAHSKAVLNIDLRNRIVAALPSELKNLSDFTFAKLDINGGTALNQFDTLLNEAITTLHKYLLLLRMGPSGLGRRGTNSPLDPNTVQRVAYLYMPNLLAIGLTKRLLGHAHPQRSIINSVEMEDISNLSKHVSNNITNEVQRMHMLAARGLWSDLPSIGQQLKDVTGVAGKPQTIHKEHKREPHLPLPDAYISEMGVKSMWIIRNLTPNLISIAHKIIEIWKETEDPSILSYSVGERRRSILRTYLKSYVWLDAEGGKIVAPPFTLRLSRFGRTTEGADRQIEIISENTESENGDSKQTTEIVWPPASFAEVMGLINNAQLAHLFVVTLSTGARKSEIVSLKRTCITHSPNGMPYANGKTFKLTQLLDGEERDWVLPDLAVESIRQQVALLDVAELIGPAAPIDSFVTSSLPEEKPTHLWAQLSGASISNRTSPLLHIGPALKRYAESLGMETMPGGQNLRPHRFRKTVARLAALALTQAPKILMDVFGHKSIEMTLYYILTDKDLQSEIEQVNRELRVMRAKQAVDHMLEEERNSAKKQSVSSYGGPASAMLNESIKVQRERLHRQGKEWDTSSSIELAEILTLQGKAWELVRPGVICTKFPGTEFGPCNKSTGRPEPSRCQSSCSHRLEEAFLREDVDKAIQAAVYAFENAGDQGDELTQEAWAGQIKTNITRFSDLHSKWIENSTVQKIIFTPNK
jgi:integrase